MCATANTCRRRAFRRAAQRRKNQQLNKPPPLAGAAAGKLLGVGAGAGKLLGVGAAAGRRKNVRTPPPLASTSWSAQTSAPPAKKWLLSARPAYRQLLQRQGEASVKVRRLTSEKRLYRLHVRLSESTGTELAQGKLVAPVASEPQVELDFPTKDDADEGTDIEVWITPHAPEYGLLDMSDEQAVAAGSRQGSAAGIKQGIPRQAWKCRWEQARDGRWQQARAGR